MNTHKFWREIQQTKWHFWEERRVFPFVLHYYVQLYCEGDEAPKTGQYGLGSDFDDGMYFYEVY
jgi:hypothetical protein